MSKPEDFLFEILTEELPPKALSHLSKSFLDLTKEGVQKAGLTAGEFVRFATPRRLAILIKNLQAQTEDQLVDRKGPAKSAAFDGQGNPTKACIGFARSVGVSPQELEVTKSPQGEWMTYKQKVKGKTVNELMPPIIEQALQMLPIPKRMRWGDGASQFVRPVHSVIMLFGDQVIPAKIFDLDTNRITRGHRFMAPDWITIPNADTYESLLSSQGFVIADFDIRKQKIKEAVVKAGGTISSEAFLDEVTGLVEWPVPLQGKFDKEFLKLPSEVLISAMQDHQRYFPVMKNNNIAAEFIFISNIQSHNNKRLIHDNERVLRARLSDAAFFYQVDQKEMLIDRVDTLKTIVYSAKLGTVFDKSQRVQKLAGLIAKTINADIAAAERAALLAKTDLTTNLVGEFPELQGTMGAYYARSSNETEAVALAIGEQYMPRFSGSPTPRTKPGMALAIADRIDTLVGLFGVNQIPTGDKDPYGLRRAALGIIRTLIENHQNLNLKPLLEFSISQYQNKLENKDPIPQILTFIQERLRAYYQEKGISPDIFSSVAALEIYDPVDIDQRVHAVQTFKKLAEAETLSIANKRVSNILGKYQELIAAKKVDPKYFENAAETELAKQLEAKSILVTRLSESGKYDEVLMELADLKKPIDDFFDQVMVMTDDKPTRENRLLLLSHLRALFLQVADIALLQ